ncbi:MAG: patatin-like phospholipase family protein [Xanthobacteraceae bacterium]
MSYKILSLDGGGTWALLQAMALEDLYPGLTGLHILNHFDLAVANSGGSIVLAGLMLDLTPADIQNFFEDEQKREAIFYKKSWTEEELAILPIFPRYVAAEKRIGLAAAFGTAGNITLSRWPNQPSWPKRSGTTPLGVLILTFDYDRLREDFLRSYKVDSTGATADVIALVDAVHASTNAPVTYFDAPALVGNKRRYWDGAMGGYNNPLMAGVVDALALKVSPKEIQILSIGTGTVRLAPSDLVPTGAPSDVLTTPATPGIVSDAGRAAGCITDDPPDAASYTAHIVLGNDPATMGRVVRLNPTIQPVLQGSAWAYPPGLPQAIFDPLSKLGMDAVEASDVELIKALGNAWIRQGSPNQPIRMLDDLSCALGDTTYAAAKARWFALPC